MSQEAYLLILNSQGTNLASSNAVRTQITYDVNWGAILPKKYKRFHCQFVFKSQNYAGILADNGFVNINLGRMSIFDGKQQSQNIGMIYPVVSNNTAGSLASYYNSTNNDNNDFWINYPTMNQITVNLNTFAGVAMGNMPHYCIYLSLVGIPDE